MKINVEIMGSITAELHQLIANYESETLNSCLDKYPIEVRAVVLIRALTRIASSITKGFTTEVSLIDQGGARLIRKKIVGALEEAIRDIEQTTIK